MNLQFVQRHAPQLAMRAAPKANFGGMNGPEEAPMQGGTPLPYIQEQGGPREYFDGSGRGPITDLRSWTPPSGGGLNDSPIQAPAPAQPEGTRYGQRGVVPIPPDTSQFGYVPPAYGFTPSQEPGRSQGIQPQDILQQPYNGPRARAGIPMSHRIQDPRIDASEQRQREEIMRRSGPDGLDPAGPQGGTLQEMLSRFGWRIPQRNDGLRGRSDVLDNPEVIDERTGNGARVRRTSQGPAELPDFTTEQGLIDFNNRMGLRLRPQVRTQAEQDSLYNRGLTPTRNSAHITGRAFDWPRSQLPRGLSGRSAEQYVRDRFVEAYGEAAAAQYVFDWESGRGRHQGSGPHVHAEPK